VTRLETERLVLRPPLPEDAPSFNPLWRDAEAVRFVGGTKGPDEVDAMVEGHAVELWSLGEPA
jgi:RimJ/RimL family protein N-acetyltransferase